jgi:ribose/xylose/arabinose/galactoside ABC-type transport system permease subunit
MSIAVDGAPTRKWPISPVTAIRAIVLIGLAVTALTTPGFISFPSMMSLLTTVSFIGCVAVGMTLITISGNIMSFSLGATVGASAMMFIVLVNALGVPSALSLTLLFGGLVSGAQGFIVGVARANPIIVSIASLSLIYGVAEAFAESGTIYAVAGVKYGFLKGATLGVPIEFVLLIAVTLISQALLSFTVFGREVFMVGSSYRAAIAIGARAWRVVTGAYLWAGVLAGLAGVMLAIRYDSASMSYGVGYDYDAVAAVLVGGTPMKGGEGSVFRTLVGALVIAVIQVVLLLRGFNPEWQYFISGLIVLGVIMLQTRGTKD